MFDERAERNHIIDVGIVFQVPEARYENTSCPKALLLDGLETPR